MIGSGASLYGTPIPPIVRRHAQDAAWYWSQLETDRLSPVVSAQRARHYQRLLACHLEGLHLEGLHPAGDAGWTLAFKELDRWKAPEQLFVCWWLALLNPALGQDAELWPFLSKVPRAEAAVAAALLWSTPEHRAPWVHLWLHGPDPQARRMALEACALCGEWPDIPISPLFTADPPTVVAACKLVARLRLADGLPAVRCAAQTGHPEIREQAGVALLACRQPEEARPLLLEALLRHHAARESGEGESALFEEHRAQVLACLYGHALSVGELAHGVSLAHYLQPLVCAHHGYAAALPLLGELLETVHAPAAFRAICRLTGLDPDTDGLSLPPVLPDSPNADPPDHYGQQLESGLPVPDAPRVRAWLADHASAFPPDRPLLCGREATLETCLDVLETGMQDERFAAACHAMGHSSSLFVDSTAPPDLQKRHLLSLRHCCTQEHV